MTLPIVDLRASFRPLGNEIVATLRRLTPDDYLRPTIAGSWRVRDIAAHLLDTALRRLSFQRDRHRPPPDRALNSPADFVSMINDLNATWIRATNRLSPRVIADLYAHAVGELSDLIEAQDLDEPAIFPVSWAGEHEATAQWLDIGREFTEIWHHGSQIREAVGAGPFTEPRWLHAVLQIAMHAMPFAYREVRGAAASIVIDITGPGGGCWTMTRRRDQGWEIEEGSRPAPSMKATMTGEAAWKLLFNALPAEVARKNVAISGDPTLAPALLAARSVIV